MTQQIEIAYWMIVLAVLATITPYIFIIHLYRRMQSFVKQHTALRVLLEGKTIDEAVHECLDEAERLLEKHTNQEERLEKVETKLRVAVDRVVIKRFNAFEHMSSDLSFTVAMINQEADGIVLTAINNRDDLRVYAKPVNKGICIQHLMEEEKAVIEEAKNTVSV